MTKCFGETLGAYFATQEGISVIAVRIGNCAHFERGQTHSPRDVAAFLSPRDAVHLLTRCIGAEDIGFAVVHAISNNRCKRLDLSGAPATLQNRPEDDGFAILGL